MAAVFADEATVRAARRAARAPLVDRRGQRAASSVVVSGDADALAARARRADGARDPRHAGWPCRTRSTRRCMEPMLDDVRDAWRATVTLSRPPRLPLVSNVDRRARRRRGRDAGLLGAATPASRCASPTAMRALLDARGRRVLLEVGPGTTLLGLAGAAAGDGGVRGGALARGRAAATLDSLLEAVGAAVGRRRGHRLGAGSSATRAGGDRPATYPFQRERHWASPVSRRGRRRPDPAPADTRWGESPAARASSAYRRPRDDLASRLTADAPGWLRDHRVHDTVVLPGTAYLEIGLAVAAATAGAAPHVVEAVAIEKALALRGGRRVHGAGRRRSAAAGGPHARSPASPTATASGSCTRAAASGARWARRPPASTSPGCARPARNPSTSRRTTRRCSAAVSSTVRASAGSTGSTAAPDNRSAPCVCRPTWEPRTTGFDPALLDACLQACGAALPVTVGMDSASSVYLPIGVGRVELYRHGARDLWVHAGVCDPAGSGAESLAIDLTLARRGRRDRRAPARARAEAGEPGALKRSRRAHTRDWIYEPVSAAGATDRPGGQPPRVRAPGRSSSIRGRDRGRDRPCAGAWPAMLRVRPGPVYQP